MNYDQFQDAVSQAGLEPRRCHEEHWQIKGGHRLVNIWPNTNRGFCFQAFGKSPHRRARLEDAIEAAGPYRAVSAPSWEVVEISGQPANRSPEVGIIRRFWRWIW